MIPRSRFLINFRQTKEASRTFLHLSQETTVRNNGNSDASAIHQIAVLAPAVPASLDSSIYRGEHEDTIRNLQLPIVHGGLRNRHEDTARHPCPRIFKALFLLQQRGIWIFAFVPLHLPTIRCDYLDPPYSAMRCFLRLSTPYLRWGQHSPAAPPSDRPDKLHKVSLHNKRFCPLDPGPLVVALVNCRRQRHRPFNAALGNKKLRFPCGRLKPRLFPTPTQV